MGSIAHTQGRSTGCTEAVIIIHRMEFMAATMKKTFNTLRDFQPDWVTLPGASIKELLDERNWSQAEFARRAGLTAKEVDLLVKGRAPITEDIAVMLKHTLGSTLRYWLNLESQYRDYLTQNIKRENSN
jgi:addiction module HigA family antidote